MSYEHAVKHGKQVKGKKYNSYYYISPPLRN